MRICIGKESEWFVEHVFGGIIVARSGIHDAVRGGRRGFAMHAHSGVDVCVQGSCAVPCEGLAGRAYLLMPTLF
jgi:hypothetical protein